MELVRPLGLTRRVAPVVPVSRPADLGTMTVHLVLSMPHGSGMEERMAAIDASLREHSPAATVVHLVRQNRYMSDDPAQRELIAKSRNPCVVYFGSPAGALNLVAVRYCVELEKAGVPTVLVVPASFEAAVQHGLSMLQCPLAVVLTTKGASDAAFVDAVRSALISPAPMLSARPAHSKYITADTATVRRTIDEEQWDDGTPVEWPTRKMVDAMLIGTHQDRERPVSTSLGPDFLTATVELVAANAVMAGAQPRHLPLLLAATEALGRNEAIRPMLSSVNGFCFPILVNGPIRAAAGLERGLSSVRARAHRSIERAFSLVIQNLAGVRAADTAFAVQGNPAAPTFLIVENEEESPWDSWARDAGYSADQSVVTIFGGGWSHVGTYFYPQDGAQSLGSALARLEMPHSALVLMSPARARLFSEAGLSKAAAAEEIRRHTLIELGAFRRSGYFAGRIRDRIVHESTWPVEYLQAPDSAIVPAYPPGGIRIATVGAEGAPLMSAWKLEMLASVSVDEWL